MTRMGRPNGGDSGATPEVIMALKNAGNTQHSIAQRFDISDAAVSLRLGRAGLIESTPRSDAMKHFPWKLGRAYHDASLGKLVRNHLEFVATGGHGMSDDKLKRLRALYKKLLGDVQFAEALERGKLDPTTPPKMVVEFDPAIPPSKGNKTGGFALVPWREEDGDLVIRRNEHAELSDEALMVLRFPKRLP